MIDPNDKAKVIEPGTKLATLIQEHTGLMASPRLLRALIREHFAELSKLAHQIHDEECPNEHP